MSTRYEQLISQVEDCEKKSNETKDLNLKIFYKNAAEGFRIKINKLTCEEAIEEVWVRR